jgi:hypothetical protein
MRAKLNDNGLVIFELQYYPTADRASIPHKHAFWNDNREARETNSAADVWLTPDGIPELLRDLGSLFHDISIAFVEVNDAGAYQRSASSANLPYEMPFFHCYIAGAKSRVLCEVLVRV